MPTISVFVSSTFRDFHAERDALVGPVRAALDDRLAPLGCRVEFIDLRWGVGSAELADDDARQARVLDVCLAEIGRSRPLFVGLIGDRYGWVPPFSRVERVAAEAGIPAERVAGFSVTELEFECGVFSGGDNATPVIFIRDLAGAGPADWRDTDSTGTRTLRDRVARHVDGSLIRRYRAPTDGRRVTDTSEFESVALDALSDVVERRARELVAESIDPYTAAVRLFFEDRLRVIAGRSHLIEEVTNAIQAPDARGVCLVGVSGAGKSAVWCASVRLLEAEGARVVCVPIGVAPDTTSEAAIIRRAAELLKRTAPQGISSDELREWWKEALAGVGPVVLAVDGLDAMDFDDARDRLEFLVGLPTSIRVLVTTTDPRQAELLGRSGVSTTAVPDLEPSQMNNVITALAASIHRDIPADAASALVAQPRSPLWLTLAVGELLALDEDDFVGVDSNADPVVELSRLVTRTVHELPEDTAQLANRIMDRLEARFGISATSAVLGALSISRSGLSPVDLVAITGADDLTIAGIRRGYAGMVVARGAGQRLGFAHGLVREATAARYAAAEQGLSRHAAIANWLATVSDADPVRQDDVLWHQLHCITTPSAASTLNALERPSLMIGETSATGRAERAAHVLAAAFEAGTVDAATLQGTGTDGVFILVWTAEQFADSMRSSARTRLAETTLRLARANSSESSNADAESTLGLALQSAGRHAYLAGEPATAMPTMSEAVARLRALAAGKPVDDDSWDYLCHALVDTAKVALGSGDLGGASRMSREAAEIARRMVAANPDAIDSLRLLNIVLDLTADIAETAGDLSTAWSAATELVDSARDLLRELPDSPPMQESLCHALVRRSRVGLSLRQANDAARSAREAVGIAQALVKANPQNIGAIKSFAAALYCHGVAARTTGDLTGALTAHRQSVEVMRKQFARNDSYLTEFGDLATALEGLAATELALGDADAALTHANEAIRIQRDRTAHDPTNFSAHRSIGVALDIVADAYTSKGELAQARKALSEGLATAQALVEVDGDNAAAGRDVGFTLVKLAELDVAADEPHAAIAALERAAELFRGLCHEAAGSRAHRDLFLALDRLGRIHLDLGDYPSAARYFDESVRVCRAYLETKPDNADAIADLGSCLQGFLALGRAIGNGDMAIQASAESVDLGRRALAAEPRRVEFARQLIVALMNHASLCGTIGAAAEGHSAAQEGVDVARTLVANEPQVPEHRQELANNLRDVAIMCAKLGDDDREIAAYTEAASIYRGLLDEPAVDRTPVMLELSTVLSGIAKLTNRAGDYPQARALIDEELQLERQILKTQPSDREFFRRVGRTYQNAGIGANSHGDYAQAIHWFTLSADVSRELLTEGVDPATDRSLLSNTLRRLGEAHADAGDRVAARDALQTSVELGRIMVGGTDTTSDDWYGHGLGLVLLTEQLSMLDDDTAATTTSAEAIAALQRAVGMAPGVEQSERLLTLALFRNAACLFNVMDRSRAAEQALQCAERWCRSKPRREWSWPQLSGFLSNLAGKLERSDRKLAKKCRSVARDLS